MPVVYGGAAVIVPVPLAVWVVGGGPMLGVGLGLLVEDAVGLEELAAGLGELAAGLALVGTGLAGTSGDEVCCRGTDGG